ncbi:ABC transporter permease [Georgenia deserti]|uniref:ABC transporter permease n=1 Tax=Georgenia deserti TaxID=2093781 RepID=A0ABW4L4T9_9MICO
MSDLGNWFRTWWLLLRWNAASSKIILPLSLVVQMMLAVGIVIGFGFLAPVTDPEVALFLATGAPTVLLLTTGLVLVPQVVGTMKQQGSYDWFRALPAPRSAFLLADITMWTVISLPGVLLALFVASIRYDLNLAPAPWAAPVALAVAATAAMVGYAIATALPPRFAQLLTQVLVFVILLFSPITFAAEVLPDWLAAAHRWMPLEPMADLLRAQLAPESYAADVSQALVLAGWGFGATALTLVLMSRRS